MLKCKSNWSLLRKFFSRNKITIPEPLINAALHSEADAAIPIINHLYTHLTRKQVHSVFASTAASASQLFTLTANADGAAAAPGAATLLALSGSGGHAGYGLQVSAAHQGPSFAAPTTSQAIAARLNKADARDTNDRSTLAGHAADAAAAHSRAAHQQALLARQALPMFVSRQHTLRRGTGPKAVPSAAPASSPLSFTAVTVKSVAESELSAELATTLAIATHGDSGVRSTNSSNGNGGTSAVGLQQYNSSGSGANTAAGAAAAAATNGLCFGVGGRPSAPVALAAALCSRAHRARFAEPLLSPAIAVAAFAAADAVVASNYATVTTAATDALDAAWAALVTVIANASNNRGSDGSALATANDAQLASFAEIVTATAPMYSPTPLASASAAVSSSSSSSCPSSSSNTNTENTTIETATAAYLAGTSVSVSPKQSWLLAKLYLRLFAAAPARSPLVRSLALALAGLAECLWAAGEAPTAVADAFSDSVAPGLFLILRSAPEKTALAGLITAAFVPDAAELFARVTPAAAPKPLAPLDVEGGYLATHLLAHALAASPAPAAAAARPQVWAAAMALTAPMLAAEAEAEAGATGTAAAAATLLAAALAPWAHSRGAGAGATVVADLEALLPQLLSRAINCIRNAAAATADADAEASEDAQLEVSDSMALAAAAVKLTAATANAFSGSISLGPLLGQTAELLHSADISGYVLAVETCLVALMADPARVAAAAQAPLTARCPSLAVRVAKLTQAASSPASAEAVMSPFERSPSVQALVLSRLELFAASAQGSPPAPGSVSGASAAAGLSLARQMLSRTAGIVLQEGGPTEPPLAEAWRAAGVLAVMLPTLAAGETLERSQTAVLAALYEALYSANGSGSSGVTGAEPVWTQAIAQLKVRAPLKTYVCLISNYHVFISLSSLDSFCFAEISSRISSPQPWTRRPLATSLCSSTQLCSVLLWRLRSPSRDPKTRYANLLYSRYILPLYVAHC